MKKGYLGPYQLGVLSEGSRALRIVAEATKQQRGVNLDAVFYASAFQGGIDKFLVPPYQSGDPIPRSQFVAARTSTLSGETLEEYYRLVDAAFSAHLPENWRNLKEYFPVVTLMHFVIESLCSMSVGASLLWTRIPDFAKSEKLLPSALRVPLSNLFVGLTEFQTQGLILQKVLSVDDAQRFTEIISSDLFTEYSAAQTSLDDAGVEIGTALPAISSAGRRLVSRRHRWLSLSSSIPSFYTTENIPLNDLHPDTVSAKRAMRGDSLCSGMVGINS